ncbi:two-partner secretion domain-containing protein [Calothrix sp. NIES-2098]|uniref:two-partner secretion domain-containing protein n=1 Tax=Calothrix sp. NIES-2098 TaxID=1954171 RepID=UPI000B603B5F|nr:filamentous hemagglutinin family outer membrane protein [Calothrix sp. NIES-2098]
MTNKKDGIGLSWLIGCFSLAVVCAPTIFCSENFASAQIIPDDTLGNTPSTITPNVNIKGLTADRIDGGAIRGANLFHSFREFNVGEFQRVYFANPPGINNILTRVTGSNISNILGTLGVDGTANLFLLNPNGIIFGKNASLDLGGSFVGSTANAIKFGDSTLFSATASQTKPLLTITAPIGLQFEGNTGSIQVQGDGQGQRSTSELIDTNTALRVQPNQTLALVGGNLTLEGGTLKTAGGRIELGSVAGSGVVSLTPIDSGFALGYSAVPTFGDIQLSGGAVVDTSGAGGGDIQVLGRRVTLQDGSQIEASTLGVEPGKTLTIRASNSVELIGATADGIPSTVAALVYPRATGAGGNLIIETGSLILKNGGQVVTITFSSGAGGSIEIKASDSVELIGSTADVVDTALGAQVYRRATGRGGGVTIETKKLSVIISQLGTVSVGKGNAGNLTVRASDSVEVSGKIVRNNIENPAGLLAQVNITGEGRGGNLTIETKRLSVSNGGKVQVATFGQGDAGNLLIRASEIEVFDTPSANLFATGINAGVEIDSDETAILPKGNGGDLTIETESLSVRNGATVSVATSGQGNAGRLRIRASKSVDVVGTSPNGKFKSQITAAVTPDGTGSGGSLQIDTGKMIVRDGAEVTVSSLGRGVAGNIDIQARSLSLDNQSSISAITRSGNGGDLTLNLQELILLRHGSQISTNAGNNEFGGDGGNITINSPFIVAVPNENSDITANAFKGAGGKIQINATGIFGIAPLSRQELERLRPLDLDPRQLLTNDITAVSQQNPSLSGTIQIATPDADPSRGLAELPSNLVDVSGEIANGCIPGSRQSQSSFIATGRGGLPLSPNQPLQDTSMLSDWVRVGEKPATSHQVQLTPALAKSATQIVEAQGWVVDGNGDLVLVAQKPQKNPHGSWQAPVSCPL